MGENSRYTGLEIAVIGMAGRFPGARNIQEFWENLKNGVETVTFFNDEELLTAGVTKEMLKNPNYIKAGGYLEGIEEFDAQFFDYAPIEAEVMDPQMRLFHECAWEALEDAGYVPDEYDGLIGLFAGASESFYWKSLAVSSGKMEELGQFELDKLANKDYLCARAAYKLDLKGPVVFLETACSTSLVAIHMACQGLLAGETDIALAGGVSIIPYKAGYMYQEGMIQSPDGHCRAFDADAQGCLAANGLGIVVLKRLEEALDDRDHIYCLIKGSALNNDGMQKMGFTAPSVEQQAEVIRDALKTAQLEPESITYVEAHGTGTPLGDPVEIEALKLAFNTDKRGFCGIGSVKSNFGHLDNAAGVAGFIKAVLALEHRLIPPGLNFEVPNPKIDFINSPFYINAEPTPWERGEKPLRAGVTSLGIGGTNVHVILEEAPAKGTLVGAQRSGPNLILLSARTQPALEKMKENLSVYLQENPGINLADAAYTLHVGRKAFKNRWMAVCSTVSEAVEALTTPGAGEEHFLSPEDENSSYLEMEPVENKGAADDRHRLTRIGRVWLSGQEIDWKTLYARQERHRLRLPTYPFQRQRYWLEGDPFKAGVLLFSRQPGMARKSDIRDWFYLPSWKRVSVPAQPQLETAGGYCWLVFDNSSSLGAALVQKLESKGEPVVTVSAGSTFVKENDKQLALNPGQEDDYIALFDELWRLHLLPNRIVHLWGVTGRGEPLNLESVSKVQELGFYSLLSIARAVGKRGFAEEIRLAAVTDHMQDVNGEEELCPQKAVVLGPVKVIPLEYPNIKCCSIDVALSGTGSSQQERLIQQLVEELDSGCPDPVVAYRGSYRWVQVFEPRRFEDSRQGKIPVKQRGVYLLTGGLGGIGLLLAEHLARSAAARLVLVGRTRFPARGQWQERLGQPGEDNALIGKIRKIMELEKLGAEVLVCSADVTSLDQVQQVLAQAEEHFGPIDGVVHCAGLADGEMIQRRTKESSERIFFAKITGTLVLDSLLRHRHLDFFVLCSSITAVLPMIGQVGYCAANAFLDAFALYKNREKSVMLAINWERWQGVGIAVIAESQHKDLTGEDLSGGITCAEGVEIFDRLLSAGFPQVVISSWDLGIMLQQAYAFNTSSLVAGLEEKGAPRTLLERPELTSEYVAPQNKTQERLARTWSHFFGFQQVGIEDDFFELGGDSLKALILLPKINKELAVYIPITEFFNRPTIRGLSAYIDGADKLSYFAIEAVEKREYYPLSSAQKRLYLLQQMDLDSTSYNIPLVLPLAKDIDRGKLESTLLGLITRHESLRTAFIMVQDKPVQKIQPAQQLEFKIEYFDTGIKHQPQGIIDQFIRPFDLYRAPLMRSGLIRLAEGSHLWMVDIHHIVSDGMSQMILTDDFLSLYNGEELAPLRLQYKEFSAWQNALFAGEKIKAQKDYWLQLYSDASDLPRLDLPFDHKRPEVFTFAGARYSFMMEREDAVKFRTLGKRHGGTLYMNILAALNTLFYKYSGQTDIIVGSGTAGRPHHDLQRIIGMFVNTLAQRSRPQGEKSYVSFLKEVIDHSLKALENQEVQFEELVDKLDLERNPSRNPLFDICVVGMNIRQPGKQEGGLTLADENLFDLEYQNTTARFDMTFFIHEPGEDVYINIEYYTAVFNAETIRRLVAHFQKVVHAVSENPSIKLKDIEIITEAEKQRVLREFNDKASRFPEDKTIHELFAGQVERTPGYIALIGPSHGAWRLETRGEGASPEPTIGKRFIASISYGELNEEADRLAHVLREKGGMADTIVALLLDRSIEMVTAILAVLKSGGAYLPIDPGYPQERIQYMLKDSQAGILLTSRDLGGKFQAGDRFKTCPCIELIDDCRGEQRTLSHLHLPPPSTTGLAYIIYTSGTTGRPKGVMINHRNLVRLMFNDRFQFDFCDHDVWTMFHSYCFDFSVWEMYGALLYGGKLVVVPRMKARDTTRFVELIREQGVTVLNQTPSAFYRLSEEELHQERNELRLRYVIFGGEALNPGKLKPWRARYPHTRLVNMFGITETTVHVTYKEVTDREIDSAISNIGKPIPTLTTYIMDGHLSLLPIGIPGELCVAGHGLGRGYLNRSELTVEKFVENPFSNHQLMYRSGDLGRMLDNGDMEYLGRIDTQVKIRGHRIELGEIEKQLLAHEQVKEAVVIIRKGLGELEDHFLCAYVVSRGVEHGPGGVGEDRAAPSLEPGLAPARAGDQSRYLPEALREFLSRTLPEYMIPAYFIPLESIPLTANGKLDRKALPDLVLGPAARDEYIVPRNELEEELARIWLGVLGLPGTIGIDDNFFELGGHSLNAAVMTSRIHRVLGVRVPLVEVFKNQTIRHLSQFIAGAKKEKYESLMPVEKREYFPLSSAQKRLSILQQLDVESTVYNVPQVILLTGEYEKGKLEETVKRLIARHESLRTSTAMVNDQPVQRIHDAGDVDFEIEYYRIGSRPQASSIIKDFVRPFDLCRAPLLRVGLIELAAAKYFLLIDLHHIITDGTSMELIKKDFTALYEGQELPLLRIQYKDFSEWQNSKEQREAIKSQQEYWLKKFSHEIPLLNLPFDYPRPPIQSFAGDRIYFELEEGETAWLNKLARSQDSTMFMVLLAAFNILLAKLADQEDILVGTPIAARRHANLEKIVGMFVNTIVLGNQPAGEKTFKEFLKDLRANALEAFENQEYQFEDLVDQAAVPRDTSRNPIFEVMFIFLNQAEYFLRSTSEIQKIFTDSGIKSPGFKNVTSKFDMSLTAGEKGGKLSLDFEYCSKLFKPETIERLIGYFKRIIGSIIEYPGQKISEIELIDRAELLEILNMSQGREEGAAGEQTVHGLFEETLVQVSAHDRTALVQGDKNLSYGELNKRANQLARVLRKRGVRTDAAVGLMVQRSFEMIVGMMAVLKAGGAYLPIDDDYPEERKKIMLADSGVKLLLTTNGNASLPGGVSGKTEIINIMDETLYRGKGDNLGNTSNGANLLYIIYTSGSTGTPKGVMLEHGNLVNLLNFQYRYTHIDFSRVLQFTTISFDVSFQEIFSTLCAGGKLYLIDKHTQADVPALFSLVEKNDIKTLFMPASYLKFVMNEKDCMKYLPRCVAHIISAGEQLVVTGPFRKYLRANGIWLYNHYGPSETHVVTGLTLDPAEEIPDLPSIGRPVMNTGIYILDKSGHLQPPGVSGELYIGGLQVGRGYLGNEALTAEKFIQSPFNRGDRLYRSGDLARWGAGGCLEFLGRIDFQVKIRGFRVELEEVTSRLLKNDQVKEAVVIDRVGPAGDKFLCAYIVANAQMPKGTAAQGTALNGAGLREYLARFLPEYMVPSLFIQVEKIPLTPNRKVDREALPMPEIGAAKEYTAPRNRIEAKLVEIWSEVLAVQASIGIDDKFFDLGGHSLKATILISKIHKALGVKLPLLEIFKSQTIRMLSEYISQAKESKYIGINAGEEREYYALSSAQRRLYFLQHMDPQSTTYNMPLILPLKKKIKKTRLESIVRQLITRHESLRTSFERVDDEPVQRIHRPDDIELTIESFDAPRNPAAALEFVAGILENFVRPWDLARAPLLRLGWINTAEGKCLLLVDMHHIVADGTSHTLIGEEFVALLKGDNLPRLRLQYKDFSGWQNNLFASGQTKTQENYWLDLYADAGNLPRLDLPADFSRPEVFTFAGDLYEFTLDRNDALRFKSLGSRQGASLFMNVLAALDTLFYKYTGQEDIVIGSGISGRPHEDLQGIMGMFVNTLAVRGHPQEDKTYESFLDEVVHLCIEAFENQDVQFEHLVERLDIERDTARNPLFDISMVVQNFPSFAGEMVEDMSSSGQRYRHPSSKFDMTFFIYECEEDVHIQVEYYTGIFKGETIKRLAVHFQNVIKLVISDPFVKLKDIEITSEQERQQILYEFNDTCTDYPREKTIHELLAGQVDKTPDQVAVIGMDHGAWGLGPGVDTRFIVSITYRELNDRSRQLAQLLRGKAVRDDALVGLLISPGLEMIIGILAVLKAGGAYLPLAIDYPAERIEYMMRDSKAGFLLTRRDLYRQFEAIKFAGDIIDLSEGKGDREDLSPWPDTAVSGSLAYVIYTSGSTGKPKGVMIEHGSVVRLVKNSNFIVFSADDRLLLTGTFVFDITTFEIWAPLLNGFRLYLVEQTVILNGEKLAKFLHKNRISILHLIPQLFNQLADQHAGIFDELKYFLVGGDLVQPYFVNKIRNMYKGVKILHMYGPTENTTFSTFLPVEKDYEASIPIGKPVGNSTAYITDRENKPKPLGAVGELIVAGDGVARGYLNNPELTGEKFADNPFVPGDKMYRTGDLARWLGSDHIEFLGRIDLQVKIRGMRIELGEIEAQLLKHQAVKETVVLAREDDKKEKYLCAYIVKEAERQVTAAGATCAEPDQEFREFLSRTLPGYMIPSHFVLLERIPLTANGKVDRKALPGPVLVPGDRGEYIAPRDELEENLVRIWSEVLGVPGTIGIEDNFFVLGGHSLKATVLTSRIFKELGVRLPLPEVFRSPTIKGAAEIIRGLEKEKFAEIEPLSRREYYELSFNQKRLWILQQRNLQDNSYNMPDEIVMNHEVDEGLMQRTVAKVIEKHESLRTGFREVNGQAMQYVLDQYEIPFRKVDISALAGETQERALERLMAEFALMPFNLDEPPLFKTLLIKSARQRYILGVNMHHIVSDGWSIGILEKDFNDIYHAYQAHRDLTFESARVKGAITYKDFAAWHNRLLENGPTKDASRDFWIKFLEGELPPLRLPRDIAGPDTEKKGASFRFVISSDIKEALKELGKKHDITLFTLMYAVYNIFLSLVSGQRVVVSSIVNAGRDHPSLLDIVGFFVNSVIFKKEIDLEEVFIDFAAGMQGEVLEFFKHQNYPLELVLDEVRLKYPQVTASFNMITGIAATEDAVLENLESFHSCEMQDVKFDIEPYISEYSNGIEIRVTYNKSLFKAENIEYMLKKYQGLIEFFAVNPYKQLKDYREGKKRKFAAERIQEKGQ